MAMLLQRTGIFRDSDQSKKTLLALNSQRSFSQFCDVVLRVCGTQIFAHSSVLAAASPYFSSFLGIGSDCPRAFSQKQPQVIEIHIDNVLISEGDGGYGEAVCKVVEYIYTNEITITTNLFAQIIEIGRIMLLDQLLLHCDEFQRGVDGNKPKTVSTCTSTLMEVVSLLGTRSRSRGKADAQTETEETLFAKISDHSSVISDSISDTDTLPHLSSRIVLPRNEKTNIINLPFGDKRFDALPFDNPVKDHESLIFGAGTSQNESDSKKRDSVKIIKELHQNDGCENNVNFKEKPTATRPIASKESEAEENFNTIKSFEDILEYDSVSAEHQPPGMIEATGNECAGEKVNNDQPLLLTKNISRAVTSIELHDISDLVTFNSIPSNSSKVKSRGTGRPRGRPRKRKRGRPKGRKDVDRNNDVDAASDYEFEELITKLEKGENIEPPDNDDVSHGRTSDLLQASSPLSGKKSHRIKSRPSQFRKDYILHSLKKKTRKQYGSTIHDRISMQPVAKALEPVDNELKFLCQKCDFTTTVFKAYVTHLSNHPETDTKSFLCHECGFKTSKSKQFKRHKEQHMAEELICNYCLFKASDLAEYKEHRLKHAGEFPYFCNMCDSRFKKKCQLESHKPKHWLQKPFTCPVCKAGFKWKHALKNHMITHTTVKDHLCDICGYATAHKSMLTTHRLIHSGEMFKCLVEGCHFEATKRQKLKMHMVTHTREKPHQCDVCGQRFSLAKNMRRHLLLHSNTRPIACKICSFTTTRYDKLKDHNLKMHNIGGPSEPKKTTAEDILPSNTDVTPTVTIVTTENFTLNPDGTISAESLQKIAELAAAQQNSNHNTSTELSSEETMIKFEQPNPDDNGLPIIAHIQYAEADVEESAEPIQYLEEIG